MSWSAEDRVDRHLANGMSDREIAQTLENLGKFDSALNEQDVRDEILGKRGDILDQLAPLLESSRRADASMATALDRLGEALSTSNLMRLLGVTTIFMIPALVAFVGYVFLFNGHLVVGVPVFAIGALPIFLLINHAAQLRRDLALPDLKRDRDAAMKRFEFAAANQATAAIRETINERLTSFSTDFRLLDQRGLRALADPEREVSTAASKALSTLMASLSSGSIGLSGPRGVGKTTLVDSFAHGRSVPLELERIGLVVSAPVKYEAKDFVLHLFASLCESVIDDGRLEYLRSTSPASLRARRRDRLIRYLGTAAVVVAVAGTAMLFFHKTVPDGPTETGYVLLVIAGVMAFSWLNLSFRFNAAWHGVRAKLISRFSGDDPVTLVETPKRVAQDHLEQIRFQQSISSGLSGSVKLPFGIGIGGDSSITMARTPWSLPEAVEAFRKYASSLTKDRYLVIGIDELDKMGSDDTAREFLNNVKGVFGVSGCYYLVSISDDAMAGFERRGLPVRDVFDSSFDAVQRIGYLTLAESRAVLESRVIGLPVPYQCLCHCMAGGLPRDLIRVARELVHQAAKGKATSLGGLGHAVVKAELQAKMAGAIEMSREAAGSGGEWVQKWLDDQAEAMTKVTVDGLRDGVLCLVSWGGLKDGGSDAACELAFEVATFNYYAATILELFMDGPGFEGFLRVGPESREMDPKATDALETLTRARQQFAIGPGLAWESIALVREARKLPHWVDPRSVPTARV